MDRLLEQKYYSVKYFGAITLSWILIVVPQSLGQTLPRPSIAAHRGGYVFYPEETLPAYQRAIQSKVDYVKCDTYLTKDSITVCIHDNTYDRTTNVEEVFGTNIRIDELTLEESKRLFIDGGAGWDPKFSGLFKVPELNEVVQLIKGTSTGIIVDLKTGLKRNRDNILAILKNNDIPFSRVIFNGDWTTNETPDSAMVMVSDIGLPNIEPSITYSEKGLLFDRTFYLANVDSFLKSNDMVYEFEGLNISASDKSSCLFEAYDARDFTVPYFSIRFTFPKSILAYAIADSGGAFLDATFPLDSIHSMKLSMVSDSMKLFVNGAMVAKKRYRSKPHMSRKIRINIGANRYGEEKMFSCLKGVRYYKEGQPQRNFDFSTSLYDINTYLFKWNILTFPDKSYDIIGMTFDEYSILRAKYYKENGYKTLVWAPFTREQLTKIISEKSTDIVMTGNYDIAFNIMNVENEKNPVVLPGARDFTIAPNYPNPFNSSTTIRIDWSGGTEPEIFITDLMGRECYHFAKRAMLTGPNYFSWDGRNDKGAYLATGLYLFVVRSASTAKYLKLLLIK